jgi:CubicO group peptidase (beta-lactamase class C family)
MSRHLQRGKSRAKLRRLSSTVILYILKTNNIMNKTKYLLISIGIFGFLISGKQATNTEIKQSELLNDTHYVSIDGLWRCTPETASQFPNGTLEFIIQINGDAFGKLSVQGCFLWESRFYDYWELKNVQFIDSTNQLNMVVGEGAIFKGTVGQEKKNIHGVIYTDDPNIANRETKLDFIRDEETDIQKLFLPRPSAPNGCITYAYQQPEQINDDLRTASIFQFIKDSNTFYSLLERIIKQEAGRLESLLIIKDQKLILEEYFYGYNRSQLHPIHSCTKSVTSLLLGIALDRHKIVNLDQSIFNFFEQYDSLKTPEKEQITLKHVLTMTAGFQEKEGPKDPNQDHLIQYILSRPLESNPGEKFKYSNKCSNLLGGIINTLENKQADEFAKDVLFNKLSISEFYWERENGVPHCHGDLYIYPRDMAKIGLLVLNNGYWNGEQIVPKEWIDVSTKPYVAESKYFDYGYQWWYRSKRNKCWWADPVHGSKNEHDMFFARGYGGQYIMVVRDLNMVIVTTSSDYNEDNGMAHQKVPMVIEAIVPLFEDVRL